MKHKFLFLILFLGSITQSILSQSNSEKIKLLQELTTSSDLIFEGEVVKKGEAFKTSQNTIYTPYEIKINHIVYGNCNTSTIQLVLIGGVVDGEAMESNHNYQNLPKSNTLFFAKTVMVNGVKLIHINNEFYEVNSFTTYGKNNSVNLILSPNDIYTDFDELFNDLSRLKPIIIPQKKSTVERVIELKKNNEVEPTILIPYEVRLNNFNSIEKRYLLNPKNTNPLSKVLASDVTLQITNGSITGISPKFYEFDVNIKSNNSASYLDNIPVWITYNTAVFGSSVVSTSSVIVTNGPSFNNPNYFQANSYISDQASNTFAFALGTDPLLTTPTRVNITTIYKLLAHVKILISNCGNVNINLSNASTAINTAFYTPTVAGSFATAVNYTGLNYVGSLSTVIPCLPTIKDFNSPVHGAVDILTIKGFGFGNIRGNGQVKFRSADSLNFPYIQRLDYPDYISWNDSIIKIKMPSRVDSISGTKMNTPGTGNFIVKANSGDSTISNLNLSSNKFKVYYSIYSRTLGASAIKRIGNLRNANTLGGYTLRLDTSISNNPQRLMCVKKAVKVWRCFTGVNILIGNDTSITTFPSVDGVSYMLFTNSILSGLAAQTFVNVSSCTSIVPNILSIRDMDMRFRLSSPWFYDTTGIDLPPNKYDFYEIVLHEIGHGIGLQHVIDTNSVMYFSSKFSNLSTILGINRRTIKPYSSENDGGLFQVSNSILNLNLECLNLIDMIPTSNGSCSFVGVNDLINESFNIIVYPNPSVDGLVNISFDAKYNSNPKLEVYNLLGEKVIEENISNYSGSNHFSAKLNLNQLSNGMYILNVVIGKDKASYKIIKQ